MLNYFRRHKTAFLLAGTLSLKLPIYAQSSSFSSEHAREKLSAALSASRGLEGLLGDRTVSIERKTAEVSKQGVVGLATLREFLLNPENNVREQLSLAKAIWLDSGADETVRRTGFSATLELIELLKKGNEAERALGGSLADAIKSLALSMVLAESMPEELRAHMIRELGVLYLSGSRAGAEKLLTLYENKAKTSWLKDNPRLQAFVLLSTARSGFLEIAPECIRIATLSDKDADLRKAAMIGLGELATPEALEALLKVALRTSESYAMTKTALAALRPYHLPETRSALIKCIQSVPSTGEIDLDQQLLLEEVALQLANEIPDNEVFKRLPSIQERTIDGSATEYRLILLRASWRDPLIKENLCSHAIQCTEEKYQKLFAEEVANSDDPALIKRILSSARFCESPLLDGFIARLSPSSSRAARPELFGIAMNHQCVAAWEIAAKAGYVQLVPSLVRILKDPAQDSKLQFYAAKSLCILNASAYVNDIISFAQRGSISQQQTTELFVAGAYLASASPVVVQNSFLTVIQNIIADVSRKDFDESLSEGICRSLAILNTSESLLLLHKLAEHPKTIIKIHATSALTLRGETGYLPRLISLATASESKQSEVLWKAIASIETPDARRFIFNNAVSLPLDPINMALHAWHQRVTTPEEIRTLGRRLRGDALGETNRFSAEALSAYGNALIQSTDSSLSIIHPFRMKPATLTRVVNDSLSIKPDKREIASIMVASTDDGIAFERLDLLLSSLSENRFMIRFAEVETDKKYLPTDRDGYVEKLRWSVFWKDGKPLKRASYLITVAHGGQRAASLGAIDPGTAAEQDKRRQLDIGDERMLIREGVREILAQDARGLLIACWGGESGNKGSSFPDGGEHHLTNILQLMRRVWPQAAKDGFAGPVIPVQIERLDIEHNVMWPNCQQNW